MLTLFLVSVMPAQMLNPAIDDPEEPFCYFSKPTDQIGVMDGREGTLITPEGYLYAGAGEMMFFTGNPPIPTDKRVKTLLNGYLPVIQYSLKQSGFQYHWTIFATTLDGKPESPLINFIRVTIENKNKEKRKAWFATGIRYQNDANTDWGVGDHRFGRPAIPDRIGDYEQAGFEFSQDWHCRHLKDAVLYNEKVLYTFPPRDGMKKYLTWKMGYNEPPAEGEMTLYVLPTTPVGIVQYPLTLQPGEIITLDFKFPYMPVDTGSVLAKEIQNADFDETLEEVIRFWEDKLSEGMHINIPEEKVTNTWKTSLVNSLIARDKIDTCFVQKVNEFQYDNFWLRDAAFFSYMYTLTGYNREARQILEFFSTRQREDGNFVSQGGQYDGFGQTLWAYGSYVQMTGDTAFAERVFPQVMKAIDWLEEARRNDPLNLIPVTTPGDNENITGHVTGHNFWALIGLRKAVNLAELLERSVEADQLQAIYDDYHLTFLQKLDEITAETGGYIPPGLDTQEGEDWGNLLSVYPDETLSPHHPWVTATLRKVRQEYQEGIMTYGNGRWLHHYLTLRNTETSLIRGEQEAVIQDLYAVLLHTSATHAGFEFSILPWKDRDFMMNLSPHGWFAAEYRILLRNMMVREQNDTLHLLSAISPEWVKKGEKLVVNHAPTYFGHVNFSLSFGKKSAILELNNHFEKSPSAILLHLPWFMNIRRITADGKTLHIMDNQVLIPPDSRRLDISWKPLRKEIELSFQKVIDDYKQEYSHRYERFIKEGF